MNSLERIFRPYDIRGVYPDELDEDVAWKVGYAAGQVLRSLLSGYDRGQASANRLVVGRDTRPHGQGLAEHLMQGILAGGLSCVDLGPIDTPMIYFAINHLGACGGIQIAASQDPAEYSGFRICGQKARPITHNTGLKEIHHIVSAVRRTQTATGNVHIQPMDLWGPYRKHVLGLLRLSRPLRAAVDAGHGMAGKMVPAVFGDTDVQITPLHFEPAAGLACQDDPFAQVRLAPLAQAVRESHADFGAAFDAEAECCAMLDEQGQPIHCDHVTALLAGHFLGLYPGATVVFDVRGSRVVEQEVRAAGGVPRRERLGHAFMRKAMADTHAVFGGELGGRFYFRDMYAADSAAAAVAALASVLSAQDRPLSELIAPLKRFVRSGEARFRPADRQATMKQLAEKFADGRVYWLDGVTVEYDDWWFNVRPQDAEPLLLLNVEARDKKLLDRQLREVQAVLGEPVDG